MAVASLGVATPAWRAGRAAAGIAALLRGDDAADDVLGALIQLGEPPRGWWDALSAARRAGGVALLLPRSGDPRGLALPRGVAAEACVGWEDETGGTWLIPLEGSEWTVVTAARAGTAPPDQPEAMRVLRAAVVDAAHSVDAMDLELTSADGTSRQAHESIVDSWVLGPPALPGPSRQLASLGLRMLLAIDGARTLVDAGALESAARSAVESAYTYRRSPG